MKPGKILVLSASHLCRNPRVLKEAAALGAAGHDVTLMSLSVHPGFEAMDRELMRGQPFRRVTLDYLGRTPRARLAAVWQRAATWGARRVLHWTRMESARALGPAHALLRRTRATPADLIIAHTEMPLWAAAALLRDGRNVAVDIEDWYSEDLLFADRRTRPLNLLRGVEKFALRHARHVSTTSGSMAAALARAYDCPAPLVLRNVFPLQPRSRLDRPANSGPPAFVWFSQTVGPGRGLELFFAAWSRMNLPSRVCLLGGERPGYREKILRRLPPERRAWVEFLPFVPTAELPDKLTAFDLGLALEPLWPRNKDLTISNKIFQYLNAGLAVIATTTAGQSEVLAAAPDAGLLITAHETGRLARQLDGLLADPARLRAMQTAARRAAVTRFCWELETPRLLAAVERSLDQPPVPVFIP